ncbi:TPA: IpaD/SipD/SspD family type III secretion system needle tip protein [Yersinia enterocolitica]|nr:IpaD/SipD/SspD family type III secretion system needle tip protein [Yersinia enterocolitica]HDL6985264.1 IpaD/SipD/SspD family type III secretion system needle tip protein [Yersinia enterocolitica]HDL7067806.1 IpaD/SipD/SspD family type III secretion system needle tip protein [Yersinia enterocolitica]HDL7072195.1 IpaD/SipD/SspD family type III secretion system needle tip protein [Yersinia enterocolitica]
MILNNVISDNFSSLREREYKHEVNPAVYSFDSSPMVPETVNVKTEFFEGLSASLLKLRNTLKEGHDNPSSAFFLSRRLSVNSFLNEFQCLTNIKLNDNDLASLEHSELEMVSTISSDSSLIAVLVDSQYTTDLIPDRDIFNKISELMDSVNTEYLSLFETAVEKQTEFWRQFTAVQAKLADYTSASKSDIKLQVQALCDALVPLMNLTESKVEYVIYPVQTGAVITDLITEKDAKKWADAFGLPESCVVVFDSRDPSKEFGFVVTVDMNPIQKMYADLKTLTQDESITMNPAKYQAWLTGFNAQAENIKSTCQAVMTKYSSANSLYDTLIKLLTSTITTMTESAKEYLKF